jgi:hypothetical protein
MMAVDRPKNNRLCARTDAPAARERVLEISRHPSKWRYREPRGYNSAADIRAVHQHAAAADSGCTYQRAARLPPRNAGDAHRGQRLSDPRLRGFNGDSKTLAW